MEVKLFPKAKYKKIGEVGGTNTKGLGSKVCPQSGVHSLLLYCFYNSIKMSWLFWLQKKYHDLWFSTSISDFLDF